MMTLRQLITCAAAGLAVVLGGSLLQAQGPAFDCAKAQGEVETLICKDATLGALDRKLDEVYKAALAKARDNMAATLRADQRGWVKGRDECWKTRGAPTYLTASWTASTVRECVEGTYRVRISELQAVWQLAPAKPAASYVCQNNSANEIVATFYATDPPTARLERGDRTLTVWQVTAASGAKYEGQNVTFWSKGSDATVTWLNTVTGVSEDLQCRVR